MPRYLGVDYGTRRIGLALGDPTGLIASPAATLNGTGRPESDAQAVRTWAAANEVTGFVVGLPLNMTGTDSDQTRLTRRFATALEQATDAEVNLWDERLSSFQADELMNSAGMRRGRRRAARDAMAAQVILQSFLDARRQTPPAP